jgi:Amt family ammonium transporter
VAATLGALLTGLLASKGVNPDAADGSLRLLGIQAIGVVATFAWSGLLSYAIVKLVGLVTPLRAEEQDEWSGLDIAESGERGYVSTDLEGGAAAEPSPPAAPPAAELQHALK